MNINKTYIKFRHLLLISSCMVAVSSNGYAGKIDLLPGIDVEYDKTIPLFQEVDRTSPHKSSSSPRKSSSSTGQERFRIEQTSEWPYSVTGRVKSNYLSNPQTVGTGILIGPHHLLTAARCVSSDTSDPWPHTIEVQLGLNESDHLFGEQKVKEIYTFPQWDQDRDIDYDIALLVLNEPVGLTTGWSGLRVLKDTELKTKDISIIGYPGDKSTKCDELWGMTGKINNLEGDRLFYDVDTNEGQSGSGITVEQSEEPYTIGIHTHGTEDSVIGTHGTENPIKGNSGVYLSQDKFNQIVEWLSESCIFKTINPFLAASIFVSNLSRTDWGGDSNSHTTSIMDDDLEGTKVILGDRRDEEWQRLTALQTNLENKSRYKKGFWSHSNTVKRTEQIQKMQAQGIFVSDNMNSAGNFALLRNQIETKREALARAAAHIGKVSDASPTAQRYIKNFNDDYVNVIQPGNWTFSSVGFDEELPFYNLGRYDIGIGRLETPRKKEIKKSQKVNIPLGIKNTTTANFKCQEDIIKIEDKALWKAFEAGAHLRSDEVKKESDKLKDKIAAHDAQLAAIKAAHDAQLAAIEAAHAAQLASLKRDNNKTPSSQVTPPSPPPSSTPMKKGAPPPPPLKQPGTDKKPVPQAGGNLLDVVKKEITRRQVVDRQRPVPLEKPKTLAEEFTEALIKRRTDMYPPKATEKIADNKEWE